MFREVYKHTKFDIGAKRPFVVTACALLEKDKEGDDVALAIGTAICSCRDQYDRKKGNLKAAVRAYQALRSGRSSLPVQSEFISCFSALPYKSLFITEESKES